MGLVETVMERRREEALASVSISGVEVAPGTCRCGCGRPLGKGGPKGGRPNRWGFSGYCPAIKREHKRRKRGKRT